MNLLARFIVLSLVAVSLAAQPVANSCTDPYWEHSLRCKTHPFQVPQRNWGTAPVLPEQVKNFTRVFVTADTSVRCLDGTWPVIYVDEAVSGNSNKWIFTLTGGGARHPLNTDADPEREDALGILETYADIGERDEMSTLAEPPMKNFFGVHERAARNAPFNDYNRVRIEKCGYDRHMGRVVYEDNAAGGYFAVTAPGGAVVRFNLYQQGWQILEEVLELLGPGLTYTTWTLVDGQITANPEAALPPLDEATDVLFIGHSAGAHGLMHGIDRLATLLPQADVRALFDANFLPSIENEAGFGSANPGATAYDGIWSGTTDRAVDPFSFDGQTYHTMGWVADQYLSYGALDDGLDASCIETHVNDGWKCRDRHHVLLNHIATPFFFREDFSDDNKEHLWQGTAHLVQWGEADTFTHCDPGTSCLPQLNPAEYRERLTAQFNAMLTESATYSELATGADASLSGANVPTWYAWMPDCGSHEGAYDGDAFFETDMTYRTYVYNMKSWLEGFMTVSRTDLRGFLVDDLIVDNDPTDTVCP